MKSNLLVRVLTGVVGAPIILALLYYGPPVAFFALALAASAVAAWELFGMTHPADKTARGLGVLLTLAMALVVWESARDPRALVTALVALPILGLFVTLARLGDVATTALRSMALAFGPLYVGVPMALLAVMRRDQPGTDGPGYVVLSLMLAWFADTGGYFAGRFLGKHKLYEAVSPKKTVEGAIGGLVAAAGGAVLAHAWFLKSLPLVHALVLAPVAAAAGQAGDLGESLLKRATGVKDSGGILPGHGGILDRIDALLVTSAVTYLYLTWVR